MRIHHYASNVLFGLSKWFGLMLLIYCFSIQGMCQSGENSKIKEVSHKDYAVYSSFFATEKLPSIELPQFFQYAVNARKVYEHTVVAKATKPEGPAESGEEYNSIFKDYLKNNTTVFIIKERISVPDLNILTNAEKEKRLSGRLVEVPSQLTGEYVSLSRAGFNKKGDKALFHITWNGSAVSSYYVLMQKENNNWVIKNVEMDNLIIF